MFDTMLKYVLGYVKLISYINYSTTRNDDNQCSVIHNNRIVKISKDFASLYSLFPKFFGLDVCHVLCL